MLRTRKTMEARAAEAAGLVKQFWGPSDGGETALAEARTGLEGLKLSPAQLHDLRADLPPPNPGTTGQKIQRIDRLLKRLEKEAA